MHFPVSGVECPVWLPPAVAFVVALLTAPAGVSGAFLLLPFQMSVLGFVTPAVTPTNLIYNGNDLQRIEWENLTHAAE